MLRNICNTSKQYVILRNTCSNLCRNARCHSIKVQKPKQESVDFLKWLLLAMPVTSFGLGCWQTYRLRWKLDLIESLQAKSNSEPLEIPHDLSELETLEYRPIKVRGVFLHDKEFLIGPRGLIEKDSEMKPGSLISDPKKNQGWLVITPFRLSDSGQTILINRGWIPTNLKPKEMRTPSLIEHEVELVGTVRLTEKRPQFMPKNNPQKGHWFYRDLEEMAANIGTLPVWLDARGIPDPPDGWPLPNQTRVTLRNEHLSYLVTWFSLSIATSYMWHRYFMRKIPLK